MSKIENNNANGLCQEEHCDQKYTHHEWLSIEGFRVSILLCEKHDDELVTKYFESEAK